MVTIFYPIYDNAKMLTFRKKKKIDCFLIIKTIIIFVCVIQFNDSHNCTC